MASYGLQKLAPREPYGIMMAALGGTSPELIDHIHRSKKGYEQARIGEDVLEVGMVLAIEPAKVAAIRFALFHSGTKASTPLRWG